MTKTEVHLVVTSELLRVQKAIGSPTMSITDDMRPIGDLSGFDSQVAEDTTATILGKLSADPGTKCPFTIKEDGKYLAVSAIVDYFFRAVSVEQA